MLVGYNTNIKFKGNVYHVQTEDSGIKNPVIVTLLYLQGTILSSKKTGYAHLASNPDYKEKVREIMKGQHKSMIKELVSGKFTGGASSETDDKSIPPAASDKTPEQGPLPKAQIAKSLDDILLDYILKRDE